jgi:hypothetical protein
VEDTGTLAKGAARSLAILGAAIQVVDAFSREVASGEAHGRPMEEQIVGWSRTERRRGLRPNEPDMGSVCRDDALNLQPGDYFWDGKTWEQSTNATPSTTVIAVQAARLEQSRMPLLKTVAVVGHCGITIGRSARVSAPLASPIGRLAAS